GYSELRHNDSAEMRALYYPKGQRHPVLFLRIVYAILSYHMVLQIYDFCNGESEDTLGQAMFDPTILEILNGDQEPRLPEIVVERYRDHFLHYFQDVQLPKSNGRRDRHFSEGRRIELLAFCCPDQVTRFGDYYPFDIKETQRAKGKWDRMIALMRDMCIVHNLFWIRGLGILHGQAIYDQFNARFRWSKNPEEADFHLTVRYVDGYVRSFLHAYNLLEPANLNDFVVDCCRPLTELHPHDIFTTVARQQTVSKTMEQDEDVQEQIIENAKAISVRLGEETRDLNQAVLKKRPIKEVNLTPEQTQIVQSVLGTVPNAAHAAQRALVAMLIRAAEGTAELLEDDILGFGIDKTRDYLSHLFLWEAIAFSQVQPVNFRFGDKVPRWPAARQASRVYPKIVQGYTTGALLLLTKLYQFPYVGDKYVTHWFSFLHQCCSRVVDTLNRPSVWNDWSSTAIVLEKLREYGLPIALDESDVFNLVRDFQAPTSIKDDLT